MQLRYECKQTKLNRFACWGQIKNGGNIGQLEELTPRMGALRSARIIA
jgi:hypothetical protein